MMCIVIGAVSGRSVFSLSAPVLAGRPAYGPLADDAAAQTEPGTES